MILIWMRKLMKSDEIKDNFNTQQTLLLDDDIDGFSKS